MMEGECTGMGGREGGEGGRAVGWMDGGREGGKRLPTLLGSCSFTASRSSFSVRIIAIASEGSMS